MGYSVGCGSENMKVCRVLSGLSLSLLTLHLQAAPQTNFGDRGNNNNNNREQQEQEEDVDNKIFFGNSNLNNILLGAAVGAGGAFLTQEIINGQNNNEEQCNCAPARKKRQVQGGDTKIFGLFGGGGCDCGSPPASVEFGADCKGRPEGNPYYGCGCSDNAAGGLFTFGRRKRQINLNTPSTSSSTSGEDVNKKFLNFRCLDAALTGRNQNKPVSTGQ